MARIAGLAGERDAALAGSMLEAQRAGSAGPDARRTQVLEAAGATVGELGSGGSGWASSGEIRVVMDGSIYNRTDFGGAGGDAEWVARLYRERGFERTLAALNGDFAIALYDGSSGELWLGRDRFGVRPLYWTERRGGLCFASRPRGLFVAPGLTPRPRREFVALFAASHYRTFDNDPEASPYEDIGQLPGGAWLRWKKGRVETGRYWNLEEGPEAAETEEGLARQYRELLLDSVRIRLAADAGQAFTLSGGMDSSSVLACAVKVSGRRQDCYSSVYEDATYDESPEIKSMLASTVETWHPVRIGAPDVAALVGRMIAAHDEPVATATWLSHYRVCEDVRRDGFSRLFGGLGGDELNAGEYEHFFYFFADLAARRDASLGPETEAWARRHDHPVFRKSAAVRDAGLKDLVDLASPGRCLPDWRRVRRYAAALHPEYFVLESFKPVMDRPFSSYLKNRACHDLFRETLPCCLRAQDRHGEALGLSHVNPFLDHRLAEFMFRAPAGLKIRDGVTKHLLRLAMRGLLPEETRTRVKKTGWNAPAHLWFAGKGRELVLDLVGSREFRERGIYDVDEVRRLAAEHERIVSSGAVEDNHMMFFWQLLNLELWLRSLATAPVPRS